jgi:hypothetical protein
MAAIGWVSRTAIPFVIADAPSRMAASKIVKTEFGRRVAILARRL